MSVNLHACNGVGPLSACANCLSIQTLSFAKPKIKLEGLSKILSLFFKNGRKYKAIFAHIMNCKKKISPENFFIFGYVLAR